MEHINRSVDVIVQYVSDQSDDTILMKEIPSFNYGSPRPLYAVQRKNIFKIQSYFDNKDWSLLSTFNTINMLYLCNRSEYNEKVSEHFIQKKSYTLIAELHPSNKEDILQHHKDTIIDQIQNQLKDLLSCHALTMKQYRQMIDYERHSIQFNTIFFLPDTRLKTVPFRPRLIDVFGPTTHIARYLHRFLQSFYLLAAQSTTFSTGSDAIQELENYAKNGFLKQTTVFVTIEMKDFEMTFDHEQVMVTFERFLHDYVCDTRTAGLSFETILSLVRLIVQKQYFIYDDKLYQQIKGGASDQPIIKLLVDISLLYWQQDLIKILRKKQEIFGRNYTQLFFTWNSSKRRFLALLDMIKSKQTHLPMRFCMGRCLPFLNVQMKHDHGILRTKIYRPCLSEPYTIPYLSNYPIENYRKMMRTILIRTIHCCTNVRDFYDEYKFIYVISLFNRFPLDFLDTCMHDFFKEFNSSKLNFRYTQAGYEKLRQDVITTGRYSMLSINNKRPREDDNKGNNLDIQCPRKRIKTSSDQLLNSF